MHIVVTPRRSVPGLPAGVVPINVIAQNRRDILLLVLRVIRYLFQNGVAGDKLKWNNDMDKTGIFIEKSSPELLSNTNMRPAIFISVGEVIYAHTALLDDKSEATGDGNMKKFSRHKLAIYLTVVGRNETEAEKIGDRLSQALYLLTDEIKMNTVNIESVDGIRLGRTSPLPQGNSPAGDSIKAFSVQVTFSITYYLEFGLMQVGDLFTSMNFTVVSTDQSGEPGELEIESTQVYPELIRKTRK